MLTVFLLICTSSFALTSASAAQSSVLVKDDSTVAVVLSSDNIGADSTDHTFTAVKIMDLYKIDGVDATAYQYKLVLDEALATSPDFGTLLSNGGRVLGITAKGADLKEARANAYAATEWVSFENKYMRHDIGKAIDEA